MIGLDTNVLVRHLVQDDPEQSARATALIENTLTEERPGYVSLVTAVELVWVLQSSYRIPRARVADAMERLLQIGSLEFAHQHHVHSAIAALRAGHDFAGALIGALGRAAGCETTATFDRGALRLPDFSPA